jgi:hypothetical protein
MSFSESDRVQVRHFLGFGAMFLQADPRLENAITAVQSVADGGTRPDNSTELLIKGLVTDCQTIEGALKALWNRVYVTSVTGTDGAQLDTFKGMVQLRSEGRRLVNGICRAMGLKGPRSDAFAAATPNPDGDPFSTQGQS